MSDAAETQCPTILTKFPEELGAVKVYSLAVVDTYTGSPDCAVPPISPGPILTYPLNNTPLGVGDDPIATPSNCDAPPDTDVEFESVQVLLVFK